MIAYYNPLINGLATYALILPYYTAEFTPELTPALTPWTFSTTLLTEGELSLARPNMSDPAPTNALPFPV